MRFSVDGYTANILKYYLFVGFHAASIWVIAAIWVIYLQEQRGLSLTQVTLIDAIFWITMALAEVPTGVVADRFGRKISLVIGSFLSTAGSLCYGLAPTVPWLILANIVWAIALTFISGANEALLYESLQIVGWEKEYARITGRAKAISLGMTAIGSIAGGLLAAIDLFMPFLAATVLGAMTLGIVFTLQEPEIEQKQAGQIHMRYPEIVRQATALMRDRRPLRYAVLYLTVIPFVSAVIRITFLQVQAVALGVPVAAVGVFVMAANGAGMLGSLVAYRAGNHFGIPRMIFSIPVLLLICLVMLVATQTILSLLLIVVLSLLTEIARPLVTNIIQQAVSSKVRATVLSMQSLLFTLFLAITEPALGFVADRFGLSAAYLGLIIILSLFSLFLFWQRRRWLYT